MNDDLFEVHEIHADNPVDALKMLAKIIESIALRIKEGNLDPIPPKEDIRTKQHEFTYVSLFSGIGGFEQALNKLGGTCVMASEIDKFAEQAYQALYGHATVGDITEVKAEDVPDHDLLVGGFPCQSFSVAGKRKGFEDTRGTMFFEIARIASVKKPKILLLENVKGLVNHGKGRTLDTMIEILNEIGYVVDFNVLNSKYFGVPQNRERVFIVAVREDLIESEPFSEESMKGNTIVPKRKRQINEWAETFNFDWPQNDEVTTRLRDILEREVDEKYYLDEDKTAKLVAQLEEREEVQVLRPQRTEYGKEIRKDYEAGKIKESRHNMTELQPRKDGISNTLTTVEKDNYLAEPQMLGHVDIKGHDAIKRVYSAESVGPTLTTMGGGHREPKIAEEQTPVQYNRKTGIGKELDLANTLSASDWRGLNRNQNQNAILEEVRPVLTPDRIEKRQNGRRFKDDGEESFTLTAQDRHGVALREIIEESVREITSKSRPNEEIEINFKENGDIRPHRTDARKSGLSELNINHEDNPSFTVSAAHSPKVYGVKTRYRIRKLTPLECFRLQGFSDEVHQTLVDEGISDSQRYKMAGNAVTVNVIDAIGEKLVAYL